MDLTSTRLSLPTYSNISTPATQKHSNRNAIAVRNLCKNPSTRCSPLQVGKYLRNLELSLNLLGYTFCLYLNCSLDRTVDGNTLRNATQNNPNNFMTYRFLTETFGYSKNPLAHTLYSSTIGTFLQSDNATGL